MKPASSGVSGAASVSSVPRCASQTAPGPPPLSAARFPLANGRPRSPSLSARGSAPQQLGAAGVVVMATGGGAERRAPALPACAVALMWESVSVNVNETESTPGADADGAVLKPLPRRRALYRDLQCSNARSPPPFAPIKLGFSLDGSQAQECEADGGKKRKI